MAQEDCIGGIDIAKWRARTIDIFVANHSVSVRCCAGDEAWESRTGFAWIDGAVVCECHTPPFQSPQIGGQLRADQVRAEPVEADDENSRRFKHPQFRSVRALRFESIALAGLRVLIGVVCRLSVA
ncbi:hypothetical protein XH80_19725 [Bradyrhizobium sp. CCBAU 45384]|nr:hypothetical protein [Bradyrhizobium sp. CCBAU 45384]